MLFAAVGLTCNDWLPTGLFDSVGALGNTDRRDALRALSIVAPITALAAIYWRVALLREAGNIGALIASSIFSFSLFVAVDLYLSSRAIENATTAHATNTVHEPDELLGWRPRAGGHAKHEEDGSFVAEYEIDAAGFKSVPNKGVASARVFIFGDSYTFGHGVNNDDTYANVLAGKYFDSTVHVFNVGVMGYGIEQMYGRFIEIESSLSAHDIVVFAPTSQDIKRNMKDFTFPSKLIFGKRVEFGHRYPYYRDGALGSVPLTTKSNAIKALFFNGRWTKKIFRFLHSAIMSPATTSEALEMIASVRTKTMARGAKFALLFLPQTKERRRGRYEEDVSAFDYLDVMNDFPQSAEDLAALRFAGDSHWNVAGHQVAAAAIFAALRRAGLLEATQIRNRLDGEHLSRD